MALRNRSFYHGVMKVEQCMKMVDEMDPKKMVVQSVTVETRTMPRFKGGLSGAVGYIKDTRRNMYRFESSPRVLQILKNKDAEVTSVAVLQFIEKLKGAPIGYMSRIGNGVTVFDGSMRIENWLKFVEE